MKKITLILFLTTAIARFSFAQQLDSLPRYLEIAAQNNPSVKAAFHTYEAALQKIPQMGAYEDPKLDMGFFLEPMELVDGRQIAQFQLMQMFPWFGTKKAAQTEAQHMAQMSFESFRETRDNLFLEVYIKWYNLCSLQQKLLNNQENIKLLQQLENLAVRKFSTGGNGGGQMGKSQGQMEMTAPVPAPASSGGMSGMNMGANPTAQSKSPSGDLGVMSGSSSGMSEVLRIQLEIVELESNIESILSEITAAKAGFNALLNRPAETEIIIPNEFSQIPFLLDVTSVSQKITEQNPMLGMIREETLAYEAKLEMEKKMGYPMFGIGLQYMLLGKTKTMESNDTGMNTGTEHSGMDTGMNNPVTTGSSMKSMNGKDMLMPMVSISIPIYRNKYKAAQRESRLLRQAGEERFAGTFNNLQTELYQYKHQLDDAARKITLYKKQSDLARTTYELVVQEFASGKSELGDAIQVQRQLLDYRLKESEATANYNIMVANIQKLTTELQ
ncbi:transporter [Bacteroidia bacterium]|nr:transporter [Bacteroidia bacterium]